MLKLFNKLITLFVIVLLALFSGCAPNMVPALVSTVYVRDTVVHTIADTLRILETRSDTVRVENERVKVEIVRDTVHNYYRGYAVAKPETIYVPKVETVYKMINAPPLPTATAAWYDKVIDYIIYGFAGVGVLAVGVKSYNWFAPKEYRLAA